MTEFRVHKLMRIIQGLIGIILIFAFQKYILTDFMKSSELLKLVITVLLVILAFVMLWITKNEVVQFILSFMSKEDVIDVRTDYMIYNWDNLKNIPTSGVYFIRYIIYKGDKIVVKVVSERI